MKWLGKIGVAVYQNYVYYREEDFILSYNGTITIFDYKELISFQGDFEFFLGEDLGQTYLSVIIN